MLSSISMKTSSEKQSIGRLFKTLRQLSEQPSEWFGVPIGCLSISWLINQCLERYLSIRRFGPHA
jgi:hypothetical protein